MANSRQQVPTTNLKDRIAALEQRNSTILSSGTASRATSPTPSSAPGGNNGSTTPTNLAPSGAGALRDKIAKFERKGGVPVPRGRFGLGVPPPIEGPRRQGELYGNRIPAPARTVSGGFPPLTRSGSPGASSALGSPTSTYGELNNQRRSVSLSNYESEYSEDLDYTPVTSPTFVFPPDSPESTTYTPQLSPHTTGNGDTSGFNKRLVRGTLFADALDIARKAESAKLEPQHTGPLSRLASTDSDKDVEHLALVVDTSAPIPATDSPVEVTPTQPLGAAEEQDVKVEVPPTDTKVEEPPFVPAPTAPVTTTHTVPAPSLPTLPTPQRTIEPGPISEPAKPAPSLLITEPPIPVVQVSPPVINTQVQASQEALTPISQSKVALAQIKPLSLRNKSKEVKEETQTPIEIAIPVRKGPPPSLDAALLEQGSPAPHTDGSITNVVTSYMTGAAGTAPFRPSTPPKTTSEFPVSPAATLAYDSDTPIKSPDVPPVPQMSDLLSPPQSGILSGSSFSSSGSRSMSMIETSPGMVSRALRVMPSVSKGVPTFIPPNTANPRKSEFIHFPPTPSAEDVEFPVSGPKSAHPYLEGGRGVGATSRRAGSESNLLDNVSKSATLPASKKMDDDSNKRIRPLPQTPQISRIKRATILEPPMSPGQGELVSLLQEAVLLQGLMDQGELPGEALRQKEEEEEKERKRKEEEEARAKAEAKAMEEEKKRIALVNAQLQAKRDEPTQGRLKHTFLIPLSKAKSIHHRKEVSAPGPNSAQGPKSAGIVQSTSTGAPVPPLPIGKRSLDGRRPSESGPKPSLDLGKAPAPSIKSTKSPKTSRFSSFRRLGSISRSSTAHAALGRSSTSQSVSSEISSSEDSGAVATPADNMLEFGSMTNTSLHLNDYGSLNGSSTSFPSLSPKKSSNSLGRAASFAEKMWSRSRTKSGASVLTSTSELAEPDVPRLPPIGGGTSFDLPVITLDHHIPNHTFPKRSDSLKKAPPVPPIPNTVVPQPPIVSAGLPSSRANASQPSFTPTTPNNQKDFLNISELNDSARPSSAFSVDSAGSLPSPLFDKALFDAFPSVPGGAPPNPPSYTPFAVAGHRRETSFASALNSSFDSAFLDSAIHLASSHRNTTSNVPPVPPARSMTTSSVPRRSGETAR